MNEWLKDNWGKVVTLTMLLFGAAGGYAVLLYKMEVVLTNQVAMQTYSSDKQVADAILHTKQNIRLDYLEKP